MSIKPGVFESRGYPTSRLFQQRGNNTFAVEWTGQNLDPYIRDFVVLRAKPYIRGGLEFFVARDLTLIIYTGPRVILIPQGFWLVDQGDHGPMGWVVCEPKRFWHLYKELSKDDES